MIILLVRCIRTPVEEARILMTGIKKAEDPLTFCSLLEISHLADAIVQFLAVFEISCLELDEDFPVLQRHDLREGIEDSSVLDSPLLKQGFDLIRVDGGIFDFVLQHMQEVLQLHLTFPDEPVELLLHRRDPHIEQQQVTDGDEKIHSQEEEQRHGEVDDDGLGQGGQIAGYLRVDMVYDENRQGGKNQGACEIYPAVDIERSA